MTTRAKGKGTKSTTRNTSKSGQALKGGQGLPASSGKENVSVLGAESSAPSQGVKIVIPPSNSTLRPIHPPLPSPHAPQLPPQPSRVQPSRTNKASKMAEVLASIEDDDDSTTRVPGKRRRRVEDEPEQFSTVPEGIERNPMAPTKKRKKEQISLDAPPLLPLQPARPEQRPPRSQHVPLRQPQSNSSTTSQPSGRQSVPQPTTSQPSRSHLVSPHQSQQLINPQPSGSLDQLSIDNNLRTSLAAFDKRVGLNHNENDGYQNNMAALDGNEDVDMVASNEEDEQFPQESQALSDDDIYASPPPRQQGRKYVHESDFDQPLQIRSPQSRPEAIDRVSPSEEEDTVRHDQWNGECDVLDNHRARNKPNKPPSAERLLDAGRHQLGISRGEEGEGEDGEGEEGEGEEGKSDDDESSESRGRAIRHSKSDGTVKATTAKYYDGTAWKTAIIQGKLAFRRYIILQYLFPLTDSHLEEAELILSKIIADLQPKVSFSSDFVQNRDMNVVVFKEAAAFRGKMKDYCRSMFLQYYSDELGLNSDEFPGQRDYQENISRNVRRLIGKASEFHYGALDALGKKSNFAHPCIRALCVNFFYGRSGGSPSLAKKFPEDFRMSVPEHAVAVAATCIYKCIDEYSSGTLSQSEFSAQNYAKAYEAILRMIGLIKSNPYHKKKWDQLRKKWAEQGMQLLNPRRENEVELSVCLD